jgi:hypothetical protein
MNTPHLYSSLALPKLSHIQPMDSASAYLAASFTAGIFLATHFGEFATALAVAGLHIG